LTDLKEATKSDIRDYFLCCPLCGSKKLAVHLDGDKPNIRHFVVNKRFFKDLKDEEKSKEFFREVLDRPDADSNKLHKFEELKNDSKVLRAKTEEPRIVCCVDKNVRVIFMRVFKNVKKYEKFIEADEGRDTLSCYECGAKWHLHIGLTGLKWAELDLEDEDGKGVELLGKRLNKKDWRKMAQNAQETTTPKPREKPNEKQPGKRKKLKKKKKRAL
jgi:mRNA-degrading endonuclease RelE of RelBE toxin-antitoxin system